MAEIGAYKLRDANTGLFSSGGIAPKWSAKGKTWRQLAHVKSHIALLNHSYASKLQWHKYLEIECNAGLQSSWVIETLSKPVTHVYAGCKLEIVALYFELQGGEVIPVDLPC